MGLRLDTIAVASKYGGVNVLDATEFGIKNDNSTDNSAALQALVDDPIKCPAGSIIGFPEGYYRFRSPVNSDRQVSFEGAGNGNTLFIMEDDTDTTSDLLRLNVGHAKIFNIFVRDIGFYAEGTDRTGGALLHIGNIGKSYFRNLKVSNAFGKRPYNGIQIDQLSNAVFDNVSTEGCNNNGYYLSPPSGSAVIVEVYWTDGCSITSNLGHGMLLEENNNYSGGSNSLEGIHIGQVNIGNNGGDGIRIACTIGTAVISNIHLTGTILDTNTGNGLRYEGTSTGLLRNLILDNCWSSFNTLCGVYLNGAVIEWHVKGGAIQLNGTGGIVAVGPAGAITDGQIETVKMYNNSRTADHTTYAIDLSGTIAKTLIVGNAIENNSQYGSTIRQNGISIGASCTDTDIYANYCDTGSSTTPFSDAGTRTRIGLNVFDAAQAQAYFTNGVIIQTGTASTNGIKLREGTGNTFKYIRVNNSRLEIVNTGYTAVVGGLTDGGAWFNAGNPASGAANSVSSSGTIASAAGFQRVTTSGNVTGVIITAGSIMGQDLVIQNESANTITFAADATSHVLDGLNVVIAAKRSMHFKWDSVAALWSKVGA